MRYNCQKRDLTCTSKRLHDIICIPYNRLIFWHWLWLIFSRFIVDSVTDDLPRQIIGYSDRISDRHPFYSKYEPFKSTVIGLIRTNWTEYQVNCISILIYACRMLTITNNGTDDWLPFRLVSFRHLTEEKNAHNNCLKQLTMVFQFDKSSDEW